MPQSPTPLLGLTVPTVGGDSGIWGTELNTDLVIIDRLGAIPSSSSSVGRTLAYSGQGPITRAYETGGAGGIGDTLPSAAGHAGQGFFVKKVDAGAGAVTITAFGIETIDGLATYSLVNQWQYVWMESDGTNFQVVGNN